MIYEKNLSFNIKNMPKTFFRDNYYYELYSQYITVYKYDLFDQRYVKIDQCFLKKLPRKYQDVLDEFNKEIIPHHDLQEAFQNIKITV